MKIGSYNPVNMTLIDDDITGVNFGSAVKGQYAPNVVVLRPTLEMADTFDQLELFLEDNAGLDHTRFGNLKSAHALYNLHPSDARISDFFIGHPGVSDFIYSDDGVILDPVTPEYIWMNALVGTAETVYGTSNVNFRFVFEYA